MAQHSREPEEGIGQALCFWWPLALFCVVFDLAGALAGGKGYRHYFLPLTVSLSVAAGFTYWCLIASIPDEARWWGINKTIFAFIIGPLFLGQVFDIKIKQSRLWVRFPSDPPQAETRETLATHLKRIRNPSDTLFTWDYIPSIYFATEMKSPTRLLDAHHIFDSVYAYKKYGEEVLQALNLTPTFVVDGARSADRESRWAGDPMYRKFRDFLENQYVLIYAAGSLKVYRHQTHGKIIGE